MIDEYGFATGLICLDSGSLSLTLRSRRLTTEPFPASADKWLVSIDGGASPRWSQNDRELIYVGRDGKLMSVAVKVDDKFEAGVPQPLFDFTMARAVRGDDYVVSNDGQRLMFISRGTDGSLPPVNVILNWSAGLSK